MKLKFMTMAAIVLLVAACEPERGTGFTGIGSQSDTSAYGLDVQALRPAD